MNHPFYKLALSLLFSSFLSLCTQAQPDFTELSSPEGNGSFGQHFGGLPDLTKDGVGEFYVQERARIYVYDGATLDQLYAIDSPSATFGCDPDFTTCTADSAGDLTGDSVPDLMFGQECEGVGRVIMVDGTTGKELFRLRSPDLAGFFGHTVRLLPDMTGDGKEDWLIHAREGGFGSGQSGSILGRVYIFDSRTREAVRTLRNNEAEYNFSMEFVEVIPDLDGDGKPELVTSARFATVLRDGRTHTKAGRALVRSLGTGKVLFELLDPEPTIDGRFGSIALSAIGDVTGDGIGDIAIGAPLKSNLAGGVYLFSGANGRWIRTLHSPNSQLGGFGGHIEAMGDLNGDGVPELWIEENFASLTHLYDGRTSKLLKTIEYPGLFHSNPGPKFAIHTVQQEAPPGIRALLFAAPIVANYEGRVYYMPFTGIPQPPRVRPAGWSTNGFQLHLTGEPGRTLEVQGSTDLKNWEPVATATVTNQGAKVEDSTAARLSQRFYRALQKD